MVLSIQDLTPRQFDGADGQRVYDALYPYVLSGTPVDLSFAGVRAATSSFVNEALVRLLDSVAYDDIKRLVRITDVSRPVGRLIQDRFAFETTRRVAA